MQHIRIEVVEVAGTHDQRMGGLLKDVRGIVSTLDASLEELARLSAGAFEVLLNDCVVAFAIVDEGQRAELLFGCAILGHIQTVLALADCRQRARCHSSPSPIHPQVCSWAARQIVSDGAEEGREGQGERQGGGGASG